MQSQTHSFSTFTISVATSRRAVLALCILLLILWLAIRTAFAVNPGEGTTTTGQPLRINIVQPVLGQGFVPGSAITLTGQAAIGALNAPAALAYVVDVSGSTADVTNQDCNGDGVVNASDNFNSDSAIGDTLDCEISGISALNTSLAANNNVSATLVAFGSSAAVADVASSAGEQVFTAINADSNSNAQPDLQEVARSLDQGSVTQFTPKFVSTSTDFDAALTALNQAFANQATAQKIAFFLSDGQANVRTDANSPLVAAANSGIIVNTYSVGSGATGCAAGEALRTIADRTTGTCTEVVDPSQLRTILPGTRPTGLDHVEVSVNSGAPIMATLDALGNWSARIAACTILNEPVVATVVATDGSRVPADIRLCAPTALNEGTEPTQPGTSAAHLFLPVVVKE